MVDLNLNTLDRELMDRKDTILAEQAERRKKEQKAKNATSIMDKHIADQAEVREATRIRNMRLLQDELAGIKSND
jgi:hypothetical protein